MQRSEILSTVQNKADGNSDSQVNTGTLSYQKAPEEAKEDFHISGALEDENTHELVFDDWALSQLMARFRVPLLFFRRCSLLLRGDIFSEHITSQQKDLLFRLSNTPGELEAAHVRAVVSDRYTAIDDVWLFPVALDILDSQKADYREFTFDDHFSVLEVTFPDTHIEHQDRTYVGGCRITNSETGRSSVWIEPTVKLDNRYFVNRTAVREQELPTRVIHRGKTYEDKIKNLVITAKKIAQVGIIQLEEAREKIFDTKLFLKSIEKDPVFSSRIRGVLAEQWKAQEIVLALDAAKEILDLAEQLPLFARIPLQQAAGKLTGLFSGHKNRMASLVKELNQRS